MMQGRIKGWTWILMLAFTAGACGGSGTGIEPPEEDPAVEPFVGRWDADSLVVSSTNDTTVVNLIEIGGAFTLNVEPSGQYTATLAFAATDSLGIEPFVEIGQMTVGDGFITLRPQTPPGAPASSEYTFLADDLLRLEGPTEFDFNLDEEPDPATLLIVLQRQ